MDQIIVYQSVDVWMIYLIHSDNMNHFSQKMQENKILKHYRTNNSIRIFIFYTIFVIILRHQSLWFLNVFAI